jgi:hypothetical protein
LTDDSRYFSLVKNLTRHGNEFLSNILNKDSMVGTITARDQFSDAERIIQLDNYFARSFRDGLHRFHGHEHKFKVDSHFSNA